MGSHANIDAVNETIRALRLAGRIEPIDAATIAHARSTARSLDAADPGSAAHASCSRAHASALDRLRALDSPGTHDAFARLLDDLSVPAALGDTANT